MINLLDFIKGLNKWLLIIVLLIALIVVSIVLVIYWDWIINNIWIISSWLFGLILIGIIIKLFNDVFIKGKQFKECVAEVTFALVMGTLLMGSWQMIAITDSNKAKFLLDLKQSFYYGNKTNIKIIETIEAGTEEGHTLKITSECFDCEEKRPKDAYSEYEIDEYIINFDYMNIFLRKHMLEEQDIYYVFGWYIRYAWNNEEIKKYVYRLRGIGENAEKEPEKDAYINFQKLAERIIAKYKKENSIKQL